MRDLLKRSVSQLSGQVRLAVRRRDADPLGSHACGTVCLAVSGSLITARMSSVSWSGRTCVNQSVSAGAARLVGVTAAATAAQIRIAGPSAVRRRIWVLADVIVPRVEVDCRGSSIGGLGRVLEGFLLVGFRLLVGLSSDGFTAIGMIRSACLFVSARLGRIQAIVVMLAFFGHASVWGTNSKNSVGGASESRVKRLDRPRVVEVDHGTPSSTSRAWAMRFSSAS